MTNMRSVAKKKGARDLNDEQARILRERLEPYLLKVSGGARGLAALMDVHQSGFGRFMNGEQGTSWGVAFRAAAMMGITVNELFRATAEDLAFTGIDDESAREAARLALLDGVPKAQIESRYQGAARGLKNFKVNDWYARLAGKLEPDKLPKMQPNPQKPRQKKS